MTRKIALILLVGVLTMGLVGCPRREPVAVDEPTVPPDERVVEEDGVQPVPEGPEAPGVAQEPQDQQRDQYVQQAESRLKPR